MTFAYPILLGGLLLAGLPVLVHFLAGQKPKSLPFPAFRFLMQKRQTNTRRLRLRHLLLMLLRMMLIVLICAALARPRLFHESLGLSRERPVAMILIFDTSPSMGYTQGNETRLDLAKKRALELLDQLPADSRFLILDSADAGKTPREDFLPTLDKTRQRIRNLTQKPHGVPMSQLLANAIRRFDAWDDPTAQSMPRYVGAFTDLTKPTWDGSDFAQLQRADDAPKIHTLVFDVGIAEPSDGGIVDVAFASGKEIFTQGSRIELRATVQATGRNLSDTLHCKIGDRTLDQAFEVKAGERRTLAFTIDTRTLKLEVGWHTVALKLATPADGLTHNDVRWATFRLDAKPNVLVLSGDPQRAEPFERALNALGYSVVHQKADSALDLSPYRGVFLVSVAAPNEKLMRSLSDYVAAGGGVCVIPPGDELDARAYGTESARTLLPGRLAEIVHTPTRKAGWNLARSELRHPFLGPYVTWMAGDNVDYLLNPRGAWRYWSVQPSDPGNTIVRYDDAQSRPAILGNINKAGGRTLLLTTPMDDRAFKRVGAEEWNDYGESITSFYVTLTALCARYLVTPIDRAEKSQNHVFGKAPPTVERVPGFAKFTLAWPDGAEEIRFEDDRWIGAKLTRAGPYVVTASDPEKQTSREIARFSVNIPATESDLTRVPTDEIERSLGVGSVVAQDRRTPILESLKGHWDEPIELFPWLMIALLFALAMENLLANRFYRREDATQAHG